MNRDLIILRGLPSSGKTTFAKLLVDDKYICCADDYHYVGGEYKYDYKNAGMAHFLSQMKCKYLMINNTPKIVVANTNVMEWEMQAYIDLANTYNYRISTVIIENRHNNLNSHNVPIKTLVKMYINMDISLLSTIQKEMLWKKFKLKIIWHRVKTLFENHI